MSQQIRTITVFAHGDPRKAATWSNVPRCVVSELERRGFTVHTADLLCHPLQTLYDNIVRRLLRLLLLPFALRPPYYVHTRLHHWWGERTIRRTLKRYPDTDSCLFFNYLFYNRYDDTPTLLLGDWPTGHDLQRKGQRITFLYHRVIRQEQEAITHADQVVSLFRVRAEEMRQHYPTASIHFVGNAFINNSYEGILHGRSLIQRKSHSPILLFIGKADRYRKDAQLLGDAFRLLWQDEDYRHLQLHIIGMERRDLRLPSHLPVICHGYLNKDRPSENATYYQLLTDARMVINPSPRWGAFSSLIEAMYFYTPVIVSPFDAFTDTFGKEIDFGCYTHPTVDGLAAHIRCLCTTPRYATLCERAHERVRDCTCQDYVSKLLQLIQP